MSHLITTVANINRGERYDVYIGRAGHGHDGYFGNPFNKGSRDQKIAQFEEYFWDRIKNDPEYRHRVERLKGKILGCFCDPAACHGHIISDYLNALPDVPPIKLAVVGSRNFCDYDFLCRILQWYDIGTIISGGARGADRLSERYALEHGIPTKIFPAEWDKYGKKAGYLRNQKIVEKCDEVVAFWDKSSPGTRHTIEIAESMGKPVALYWPDEHDFLMEVGLSKRKAE